MEWLVAIIMVVFAASIWGAVRYGQMLERKRAAEKSKEDMARDAELASKPYVDRPFGELRR